MALMFPRLARNFVKNGYFPTDEPTLERALAALAPAESSNGPLCIIDPCAGEGVAIAEAAHALGREQVQAFAVEYEAERARHARQLVDRCIHGDLMDTLISRQSFGLLWLNPPYGDLSKDTNGNVGYQGQGRARLEKLFYQKALPLLQYGGVLIYIVPHYVLDAELDDPELTVRHVDLKAWMSQFYPGDRPGFLFDGIERVVHPAVSVDTLNILLADREATKSQLAELALVHETLRIAHEALAKEYATRAANDEQAREPGLRSETTYLNIIGGLLTLLLGNSPSGAAYSSFRSMDAVVSALIAHHEGRPGLSERTLWSKLAQARRHLEASR